MKFQTNITKDGREKSGKLNLGQGQYLKELGRFIIQSCPTYDNEKCSRRILNEINIYCQYIILTICKHDTFCWMTITFIEKKW